MESLTREFKLVGGQKVSLRPAAPDDAEFLLRVYAGTRDEELSQVVWGEGQREIFLRQQFNAQRDEYGARYPGAQYDLILLDSQPVGRLWVGRDDEEIRLLDIALLTDAQRRGVGAALVGALIEEARSAGKVLRHMVFVLNTGALRFYERLGFRTFEEVGGYLHMEWRPLEDE